MTQFSSLSHGPLVYLALACVAAVLGYYFARKRTEHEVGYRQRVEVAENAQGFVVALEEQFGEALEYVRNPGPSRELPVKRIEHDVDELEKYVEQQGIWLDENTSAVLDGMIAGFRTRQRDLELLPHYYTDPDFESEHERAAAELEAWLRHELPRSREELADSFRSMLGVGRRLAL